MLAATLKTVPLTTFVSGLAGKPWSGGPKSVLKLYKQAVAQSSRSYRGGTARSTGFGVGTGAVRVGKTVTLRERLLGPTTGTPFVIGTYAIGGAAVLGIGALCYYGLGLSNEVGALEKSAIWPQFVRDRIQSTYSYLGGGLVLTAASAIAAARNPTVLRLMSRNSLPILFGSLAALVGTGAVARAIEYQPGRPGLKQLAWMVHCGVLGAILAPMCFLGGPVLVRAAWYTAGIVGGLSAVAACAPSDRFLTMGGPLAMGLGVVFVSTMGTWFLPPTTALGAGLYSVAIYGGLILFGAFLLYDTQRVIKLAENHPEWAMQAFDPINAQMSIYLDIINIFIRIAMIMSMGGGRRK